MAPSVSAAMQAEIGRVLPARSVTTVALLEEKRPGQFQQLRNVVLELEGLDKPALTAWISQSFY